MRKIRALFAFVFLFIIGVPFLQMPYLYLADALKHSRSDDWTQVFLKPVNCQVIGELWLGNAKQLTLSFEYKNREFHIKTAGTCRQFSQIRAYQYSAEEAVLRVETPVVNTLWLLAMGMIGLTPVALAFYLVLFRRNVKKSFTGAGIASGERWYGWYHYFFWLGPAVAVPAFGFLLWQLHVFHEDHYNLFTFIISVFFLCLGLGLSFSDTPEKIDFIEIKHNHLTVYYRHKHPISIDLASQFSIDVLAHYRYRIVQGRQVLVLPFQLIRKRERFMNLLEKHYQSFYGRIPKNGLKMKRTSVVTSILGLLALVSFAASFLMGYAQLSLALVIIIFVYLLAVEIIAKQKVMLAVVEKKIILKSKTQQISISACDLIGVDCSFQERTVRLETGNTSYEIYCGERMLDVYLEIGSLFR